ncbi:MAG: glycosyltransferase [Armatimonadetes bacterium]|nr:glycosyltransferase [Armatimonadota bacterium]
MSKPAADACQGKALHFLAHGSGGAARAAVSIHETVREAGWRSMLVVGDEVNRTADRMPGRGSSALADLLWSRAMARRVRMRQALQPKTYYQMDRPAPFRAASFAAPFKPDIVHLHWVSGFMSTRDIADLARRFGCPIVWTVVDMAPMTGGCHYSYGCERFTQACGCCPALPGSSPSDHSNQTLRLRAADLAGLPITVVGATDWVVERARRSAVLGGFEALRIPYGIDAAIFRPVPKAAARQALGLPPDVQLLFFGATSHGDARKGMSILADALTLLADERPDGPPLHLLTAGRRAPRSEYDERLPRLDLGPITDDRFLALCYQAADAFICPSVEDAGPLMVPESLVCGTPVVTFAVTGGSQDLIRHGQTGYIADSPDGASLARGIRETLEGVRSGRITAAGVRGSRVPGSTREDQGRAYTELYRRLAKGSR